MRSCIDEIASKVTCQLDDCDAIQDYLNSLTGARSVPRVFISGKCIGGGTETRTLKDQGKLVPMLKEAGAL